MHIGEHSTTNNMILPQLSQIIDSVFCWKVGNYMPYDPLEKGSAKCNQSTTEAVVFGYITRRLQRCVVVKNVMTFKAENMYCLSLHPKKVCKPILVF